MSTLPTDLLVQLKGARVRRGWSLRYLAASLDRSGEAVRLWEAGKCLPADSDLDRWAVLLDVEVPAGVVGWVLEAPACGTYGASQRHRKRGEPLDEACRQAHNRVQRESHRARMARSSS